MAHEEVTEEPPRLSLDERQPRCVHGRRQRDQGDAPQGPVRRDWQDQPHGRVSAQHRRDRQQSRPERRVLEQVGNPRVEGRDSAPQQHGPDQQRHRHNRMRLVRDFRLHEHPASHQQPGQERHVQRVHPRRFPAGHQLQVRRQRADGQQGDHAPRLAATQRRQQDGLRDERPREREPADFRPQRRERRQEIQQRRERQKRGADGVQLEDVLADQPGQHVPAVVRRRGAQQAEVQPGPHGARQCDGRDHERPLPGGVGVAQPPDPQRPRQRDHDRQFQPGEVQFAHHQFSNLVGGGTWSESREGCRARKSVHRRSSRSNQRNSRTNGRTTHSFSPPSR